jgi:hypothetical protein
MSQSGASAFAEKLLRDKAAPHSKTQSAKGAFKDGDVLECGSALPLSIFAKPAATRSF